LRLGYGSALSSAFLGIDEIPKFQEPMALVSIRQDLTSITPGCSFQATAKVVVTGKSVKVDWRGI